MATRWTSDDPTATPEPLSTDDELGPRPAQVDPAPPTSAPPPSAALDAEAPDVPEAHETPDVPDTPDVPEAYEARETPDVPEAHETPAATVVPEAYEAPEAHQTPDVPEAHETPTVPETPDVPEAHETHDVPETHETPETPEATDTPETPETAGAPEAHEQTGAPAGALAEDGLARLVGPVHRDAARLASSEDDSAAAGADPRQTHRAGDAAVAAMCQHLATMDAVVYPRVARALPNTGEQLARLRGDAHEMLLTMRRVHESAQGDKAGAGAGVARLRDELAAAIDDHARREEALLHEFDDAVSPAEREKLVASYERTLPHAPSRPHPYLLRGPLAGRMGYRVAGKFDHLLDTMDGREVSARTVRAPGKVGSWGSWLLGRPGRASARPTESGPAAQAAAEAETEGYAAATAGASTTSSTASTTGPGFDDVLILPRSQEPPQPAGTDAQAPAVAEPASSQPVPSATPADRTE